MNRLMGVALAPMLTLALSAPAHACGDKFLTPGRGPARASYVAEYPSNILVYRSSGSKAVESVLAPSVRRELERAGHTVTVCSKIEECTAVERGGRVDVVLADLRSAREVEGATVTGRIPVVVPMAMRPSAAEAKSAGFDPSRIFDASRRPRALLRMIDSAIDSQH
jgi:hypothetical protein